MLPPSWGLEVTKLEAACLSAKLVSVMCISWHYVSNLSWYKIMIYNLMCLLKTMCFHLGMTSNYIWDYGSPYERVATEEEFDRMTKDIHYEFVKDGGKIQYSHKVWCIIGHSCHQGPILLPGRSMWDLWWKKWHHYMFLTKYFIFAMSLSFHTHTRTLYWFIHPQFV